MVSQASMNGRRTGARQVSRNVSDFAHDVITLAELQAQLVACDLREGKSQAIGPLVLMVAGLVLALGSTPVFLFGIGWLLVNYAEWSESAALLTSAGCGLMLAGGVACLGWRGLRSAIAVMSRSQNEFTQNIQWLKAALTRSRGH